MVQSFNEIKYNKDYIEMENDHPNRIENILIKKTKNNTNINRYIDNLININQKFLTTVLIGILTYLGFSMITPFVTLFGKQIGMPAILVGTLIFMRYGSDGLSRIPIGNLADYLSRPKVMIIGSLILLGSAGFYLLASNYWESLLIAQLLFGIGISTMLVSLSSYATSSFESERISKYTFATGIGTFSGSFIGGTVKDYLGMNYVFMVFLILSIGILILSIRLYKKDKSFTNKELTINPLRSYLNAYKLFKNNKGMRKVSLLSLIFITTFTIGLAIVPLYYEKIGLSATQIGTLQSLWLGTSSLIRLTPNKITDSIDNITTSITGILVTGITLTLITYTNSFIHLALLSIFWGISGLNLPAILSEISKITTQKEKGKANGIRGTVGSIGSATAVIIISKLTTIIGIKTTIKSIGTIIIITITLLTIKWKKHQTQQTQKLKNPKPKTKP